MVRGTRARRGMWCLSMTPQLWKGLYKVTLVLIPSPLLRNAAVEKGPGTCPPMVLGSRRRGLRNEVRPGAGKRGGLNDRVKGALGGVRGPISLEDT